MIRLLFGSASVLAFATAAAAQDTSSTSASIQSSMTSSDKQPEVGIGDIVVTASRREETVQRAALSIQALSSDALVRANVNKPEDLSSVATGVQIGTAGAMAQVYIRGVGSYSTQTFAESPVAFNIDGVYISRTWATRGIFYDLERVEVLKGPQGTLYGRNASGGAINIITAKPKLGGMSGFAELQVGNYNLMQATGALNIPLGDTFAVRASSQVTYRDGYLSDGYDDDDTEAARLQLLWEPTPDVSLLVSGNYQRSGGKGAGAVTSPRVNGEKFRGASDPSVVAIIQAQPAPPGFPIPFGAFLTYPKDDGNLDLTVKSINAELNWDVGFATLTVLPAYREAELKLLTYLPGFPVQNREHNEQTTVEARLGNSNEKLKWVLGAYYFNERATNLPGGPNLAVFQGLNNQIQQFLDLRTRSYAAFGQATYSLTKSFRVTGGLRYTYEDKSNHEMTDNIAFPTLGPPFTQNIPYTNDQSEKYNSVTWKAGVEYDIAPRSMGYASVSTGFKSGGFYSAPQPNTFDPEKLTAFEVGVKNRFLDNRLQVNIEGFYWKYKDHQESFVGPTSIPSLFTFVTVNAGRAKSYGVELDTLFQVTPQDELTFKIQFNESNYDSFVFQSPASAIGPAVTGCAASPIDMNGFQTVDCSGKQLLRAPRWTGNAGYSHDLDLGEHGSVRASFDVQFSSASYLAIDFLEQERQKSYAIGNFDLTYTTGDGRLSITGFIHNIWNEEVKNQAYRYNFVSPANPLAHPDGVILATVRPPRTYGARARFSF